VPVLAAPGSPPPRQRAAAADKPLCAAAVFLPRPGFQLFLTNKELKALFLMEQGRSLPNNAAIPLSNNEVKPGRGAKFVKLG